MFFKCMLIFGFAENILALSVKDAKDILTIKIKIDNNFIFHKNKKISLKLFFFLIQKILLFREE